MQPLRPNCGCSKEEPSIQATAEPEPREAHDYFFLGLTDLLWTPRAPFGPTVISCVSWPPNRFRLKGTAPAPATTSTSSSCNGPPRADSSAGYSIGRPLARSLKTTCGPSGSASQSSPHFFSTR